MDGEGVKLDDERSDPDRLGVESYGERFEVDGEGVKSDGERVRP